jgi:hypothetical protein
MTEKNVDRPPVQAVVRSVGDYTPLPPPSLNGGLYTGAPFAEGAPWRNFPVPPDAGHYLFGNLQGVASAPVAARYMMPGGGLRPGNNTPMIPDDYARSRVPHLNAVCIPEKAFNTVVDNDNRGFRKYIFIE